VYGDILGGDLEEFLFWFLSFFFALFAFPAAAMVDAVTVTVTISSEDFFLGTLSSFPCVSSVLVGVLRSEVLGSEVLGSEVFGSEVFGPEGFLSCDNLSQVEGVVLHPI